MKNEIFSIEASSIYYDNRIVLNNFDLHIYKQEVLGIVCENYSERNYLINFFRGNCHTEGNFRLMNKICSNLSKKIHQNTFYVIESKQNLIASLSISENICMFSDKLLFTRTKNYTEIVLNYLKLLNINLDTSKPVSKLSHTELIFVELMKAFAEKKPVIVLANISELISDTEYTKINTCIQEMRSYGFSFVILDSIETNIFHSVDEILIVKNATSIANFSSYFFDYKKFRKYVVSSSNKPLFSMLSEQIIDKVDENENYPNIDFSNFSFSAQGKINFSIGNGELIKIICTDHQTISDFRKAIINPNDILGGSLAISGEVFSKEKNNMAKIKQKILWCPAFPYKNAIFQNMTIQDNLLFSLSNKVPDIWSKKRYRDSINQIIKKFLPEVSPQKKASTYLPETLLKVAYMRYVVFAPKLLIIEQPFADANIELREITLSMISLLLSAGTSIICISSSISNMHLVDGEVFYMKKGKIISEDEAYAYFF